jgi:hypothetical protein
MNMCAGRCAHACMCPALMLLKHKIKTHSHRLAVPSLLPCILCYSAAPSSAHAFDCSCLPDAVVGTLRKASRGCGFWNWSCSWCKHRMQYFLLGSACLLAITCRQHNLGLSCSSCCHDHSERCAQSFVCLASICIAPSFVVTIVVPSEKGFLDGLSTSCRQTYDSRLCFALARASSWSEPTGLCLQ